MDCICSYLPETLLEPIIGVSNFCNRCFAFCAPRMYNSLPANVRGTGSTDSFKCQLKTYIFTRAYDRDNLCIGPDFLV